MSYYRNLVPGQYQLGDIVMGHGTNIHVESFDVKPYDINAQDYQVSRSDEIRFGFDSIKPTSIEMNMSVMYNWLLEPFKSTYTNFWHNMPTAGDLSNEWRANDVRNRWGDMKPLYFCGRDGIGKVIYGRPGQFAVEKSPKNDILVKCVGEFRRADTLVYSANENAVQLSQHAVPQYLWRGVGDSDTWLRVVGTGPISNPVITIGEQTIKLNVSVAEGEAFEVSSYPWQRRAVDTNRTNLRNTLVDNSAYLDQLKIPVKKLTPVRWSSDDLSTWVPYLGNQNWNVDLSDAKYRTLPSEFTIMAGKPVVRFDLFNPTGPSYFIGNREWGRTDAALYTGKTFKTTSQYMEARIVEPYAGRSGLVIMSNSTMSNFALLEITAGPGNNKLIIRNGSSPQSGGLSPVRATYTNTAWHGWLETDVIGIGYDKDTKKFSAYVNGQEVTSWVDSNDYVTHNASTNKYSGFIFDIDGNFFSPAIGFKDINAFDKATTLNQVDSGSLYLYWRDAWSTIE